jgi:hypothetical protein
MIVRRLPRESLGVGPDFVARIYMTACGVCVSTGLWKTFRAGVSKLHQTKANERVPHG